MADPHFLPDGSGVVNTTACALCGRDPAPTKADVHSPVDHQDYRFCHVTPEGSQDAGTCLEIVTLVAVQNRVGMLPDASLDERYRAAWRWVTTHQRRSWVP